MPPGSHIVTSKIGAGLEPPDTGRPAKPCAPAGHKRMQQPQRHAHAPCESCRPYCRSSHKGMAGGHLTLARVYAIPGVILAGRAGPQQGSLASCQPSSQQDPNQAGAHVNTPHDYGLVAAGACKPHTHGTSVPLSHNGGMEAQLPATRRCPAWALTATPGRGNIHMRTHTPWLHCTACLAVQQAIDQLQVLAVKQQQRGTRVH
jgi:hypothetical protein